MEEATPSRASGRDGWRLDLRGPQAWFGAARRVRGLQRGAGHRGLLLVLPALAVKPKLVLAFGARLPFQLRLVTWTLAPDWVWEPLHSWVGWSGRWRTSSSRASR